MSWRSLAEADDSIVEGGTPYHESTRGRIDAEVPARCRVAGRTDIAWARDQRFAPRRSRRLLRRGRGKVRPGGAGGPEARGAGVHAVRTSSQGDPIIQTGTTPAAGARTFVVHLFDRGRADEAYVVERFRAMADDDIRRAPACGGDQHGPKRAVASLEEVCTIRPERKKIVVVTGLGIEGTGAQYYGDIATGFFVDRRQRG